MSKQEFLDSLRRSLSGSLEHGRVEEHIRYYGDYIDSQVRQGRLEEEVMEGLGEPRLIAKTLLGMAGSQSVTEEYVEEEEVKRDGYRRFGFNGRSIMIPAWLSSIAVSFVLVVVLALVFALFAGVLRFAFPILVIIFLYRFFANLFR